MTEEAQPPPPSTSNVDAASGFWARVREHKVIQWGVGYLGAALALAHGAELVSHALHWPDVVWRACVLALIVGFPIALTLAWYHGHRGLQGVSRGELGIISALMLIGAVFLTASLRPDDDRAAAEPEPSALPVRPAIGGIRSASELGDAPKLLAVLPCDSLSTNADDANFAAGMHLEIISKLNKLRGLSVISRTSVERYAKSSLGIPQIAAELGVSAVIECTARYANERVIVTAQLIDAATDRTLWGDDYDGDLADVFAIQADIGMSIANAVGAEFSPAEQAQLERVPTTSPEAYRLYILGLALEATQSPEGIRQSETLYKRALDLDPNFARAHAHIAFGLAANLVDTVGGGPDRLNLPRLEQERQARESAQHALALDPNIGRAHAALALITLFEWRWTESLIGLRLAESTERGDRGVIQWNMLLTAYMGDPREGIRIAERGLQLNPNTGTSYQTLGLAYGYVRIPAKADT